MVQDYKKIAAALLFFFLIPCAAAARDMHYSLYSDRPELFDEAVTAYGKTPHARCGSAYRAGIVTHHFLASRLMVDFFECLAAHGAPKRVILMGPDHFGKSAKGISVSSLPWKTPYGMIDADIEAVSMIKERARLDEDPDAFSGEHSVGILIPFIRRYFPGSRVTAVLLNPTAGEAPTRELEAVFGHYMKEEGTILITSMDFSHNTAADEADRRDAITIDVITGMDRKRINEGYLDCRVCTRVLFSVLKETKLTDSYVRDHTNSSRITGNRLQPDVTSYFTVFFGNTKHAGTVGETVH